MQPQDEYPEVKLVGRADQVVLGSTAVGSDIGDEILVPDFEFQAD